MFALTLGGQAGAGAPEVGTQLAKSLEVRYVEKLAFRRLVRQLGATPEAVSKKELSFCSRKDRFLQKLEHLFTQFGWYGADISMGEVPPVMIYDQLRDPVKRLPAEISDDEYVENIYATANQFVAENKDLVYVKRAGCVTLKHYPQVTHIGLFAPKDLRAERIARRLRLGAGEAEEVLTGLEKATVAWFAKIADADPMDKKLYSETFYLDRDRMTDAKVADAITNEVRKRKPVHPNDQYDAYEELYRLLNPPSVDGIHS